MGITRKLLSVSTAGLVDIRSDKERTAAYTKAAKKEAQEQTKIMREQAKLAAHAASAPSAPASSAGAATPASQPDVFEQLRKLGELRDGGVVTAEEFDLKKAELLARL